MCIIISGPSEKSTTSLERNNYHAHNDTVEPLIKDTLNKGQNRNNLQIMGKLWCPKYRLPCSFLTSEEWTPLYNGQK